MVTGDSVFGSKGQLQESKLHLVAQTGTKDYINPTAASGGDFVLPGCLNYQALHADGPSGRHPSVCVFLSVQNGLEAAKIGSG